jgi:murein DD-endopeptidase MepM/ murein hydrolase activator NlpD
VSRQNLKTGQGDGRFGTPRGIGNAHGGIDIDAPTGTPVIAASDGEIVYVVRNIGNKRIPHSYGNQVVVYLGANPKTGKHTCMVYAHLDNQKAGEDNIVEVGQKVTPKTVIGKVGVTGNPVKGSTSHLHFEIRESKLRETKDKKDYCLANYKAIDPLTKLPKQ